MRIYISLPVTGQETESRNHADCVKSYLSKSGHTPVSPFDIYCGKNPTYKDYLSSDIRALMDCDAIMLCHGWQFSRGCRIEAKVAEEFGLQILHEVKE